MNEWNWSEKILELWQEVVGHTLSPSRRSEFLGHSAIDPLIGEPLDFLKECAVGVMRANTEGHLILDEWLEWTVAIRHQRTESGSLAELSAEDYYKWFREKRLDDEESEADGHWILYQEALEFDRLESAREAQDAAYELEELARVDAEHAWERQQEFSAQDLTDLESRDGWY